MHTNEPRFDYAKFRTLERASEALEDMFATGDVVPGERPEIIRRNTSFGVRWIITLPA